MKNKFLPLINKSVSEREDNKDNIADFIIDLRDKFKNEYKNDNTLKFHLETLKGDSHIVRRSTNDKKRLA